MKNFFLNIIFVIINFKSFSNEQNDIFNITKNLRFCGADLFSQNLKFPNQKGKIYNKSRSLISTEYKPIRIFVETTYFEYQGNNYTNLSSIVPIIKTALSKAVDGIKGLIKVKQNDETIFSKDVIKNLSETYNVTRWDPIFDNNTDIKSDFLIIVKFDTERIFPQGVLASAMPIYLEPETNRPLIGLLTITIDTNYFTLRRVEEYFSEVILHELTHALGFLYTMFPYFPNGIEGTYTTANIRGIQRTIIKTPKVLEVARKYFNCESIQGIELEDQGGTGSALSHWNKEFY